MAVEIDGVLKEWGDRMFIVRTRARPAPNTIAGKKKKAKPTSGAKAGAAGTRRNGMSSGAARQAFSRLARKVPEVMVKITQGEKDPATGKRNVLCKDMKAIKAHMDYISRNGDVPLEDENGQIIHGADAVRSVRDDWKSTGGYAIPLEEGYRREAYSVVLSMPPGTDRKAVLDAARDFAKETFDGHQYVFGRHDDESHPHVHICVRAVGHDLVRLNPRKSDLVQWRQRYAEKLRDHGIEANATSRVLRGKAQKPERQVERHLRKRGVQLRNRQARRNHAAEVPLSSDKEHPVEAKLRSSRSRVIAGFGTVAKALAQSPDADDRALALGLARHAESMPPAKTMHRLLVEGRGEGRAEQERRQNARDVSKPGKERDL